MKKELDLIDTLEYALEHVQTLLNLYVDKKEDEKAKNAIICKKNLEKFIELAINEKGTEED